MSNIDTYLAKIMSAVYGEEVRGSIHDAIEECYTDTTTGKTTADTAAVAANAAATRANTAAAEAEEIAADMDGLVKVQNTQPSEAINKVWFDTTENGEYTLPEVDDSTISDEDTWSSQKIRNEIDAGDADLKSALNAIADKTGLEIDATTDVTFTDGYYISGRNGSRSSNSDNWSYSGFIDISGYDKIKVALPKVTVTSTSLGLAFYSDNSASTYVSGVIATYNQPETGYEIREINVPDNALYLRTSWFSTTGIYNSFYDSFQIVLIKNGTLIETVTENTAKISDLEGGKNSLSGIGSTVAYDHRIKTLNSTTYFTSMAFSVTPTKYGVAVDKIFVPVRTSENNISVKISLADSRYTDYNEYASITVTAGNEQALYEFPINQVLIPNREYWLRLDCDTAEIMYRAEVGDFSNEFYTFGTTRFATSGHNNMSSNANIKFYGAIYAVNLYQYQDIIDGKITSYYDNTDLSLYETVAVIGDSYSSGAVYGVSGAMGGRHNNISWLKILGRKHGFIATLYASPGWTTEDWLNPANTDYGITAMLNDTAKNLYFIMLGINAEQTTGDITDCNADYALNDNTTFYGRYGTIIGKIHEHAPNAKIVCIIPPLGSQARWTAIAEVAEFYGVPYFDIKDDSFITSAFYTVNLSEGHPVGITYAGMANAIERQYSDCVQNNNDYFKTYTGND